MNIYELILEINNYIKINKKYNYLILMHNMNIHYFN